GSVGGGGFLRVGNMRRALVIAAIAILVACGVIALIAAQQGERQFHLSDIPLYPGAHDINHAPTSSAEHIGFVTGDSETAVLDYYTDWLTKRAWSDWRSLSMSGLQGSYQKKYQSGSTLVRTEIDMRYFRIPWF